MAITTALNSQRDREHGGKLIRGIMTEIVSQSLSYHQRSLGREDKKHTSIHSPTSLGFEILLIFRKSTVNHHIQLPRPVIGRNELNRSTWNQLSSQWVKIKYYPTKLLESLEPLRDTRKGVLYASHLSVDNLIFKQLQYWNSRLQKYLVCETKKTEQNNTCQNFAG